MEQPNSSNAPVSLIGERDLIDMTTLAAGSPGGCFVEVGVYRGGSAWHLQRLATAQGRELYLYDTFIGIPYRSPLDGEGAHEIGDFADTDYATVLAQFPAARVVQGVFPASAVSMPPVAFAHLDCDQYQSVYESAEYLSSRMAEGGIIWFDDSPCLQGARRAVVELFAGRAHLSYEKGKHYVVF